MSTKYSVVIETDNGTAHFLVEGTKEAAISFAKSHYQKNYPNRVKNGYTLSGYNTETVYVMSDSYSVNYLITSQ